MLIYLLTYLWHVIYTFGQYLTDFGPYLIDNLSFASDIDLP